ncbi:hypothetical protein GFC01_06340 [Desulfofundulus thermobenzoicus]|uniref:Uncharacterized protein n=1 Tax=Desulfofundulus thermobenzoicus TaxID=29376 RepID=A0A6N7IPJ8_9FIRM|nr:hypothetical protein [Desulfofundulus thermobenzoicus]MQL51890.1 hypothetical protein [Desulfofundulus thermobenzoicus]
MGRQKTKPQTSGKCFLCGGIYGKSGMTKHLSVCKKKYLLSFPETVVPEEYFHIVVEGRYNLEYWLHLLVQSEVTLNQLDQFLRDIWLETFSGADGHGRRENRCSGRGLRLSSMRCPGTSPAGGSLCQLNLPELRVIND